MSKKTKKKEYFNCRIRLTKPEVLMLKQVFSKVKPENLSDFQGERYAIYTFMAKFKRYFNDREVLLNSSHN